MAVKEVENISLGSGDLFVTSSLSTLPGIQTIKRARQLGTTASVTGFLGQLKGDVTVSITRTILPFKAGVPQENLKQVCTEESVDFKGSLAEIDLTSVRYQLGLGSGNLVATAAGGVEAHSETGLVLTGTTSVFLEALGTGIVSLSDVVTLSGATPTPCVRDTDYTINLTEGSIARVSGSVVIVSGGSVDIDYNVTLPKYETLTGGGQNSVTTFALRFVHYFSDGRVAAITMYSAAPTGVLSMPFHEVDWNVRDIEFSGIADTTRAEGDHLYAIYREKTSTEA